MKSSARLVVVIALLLVSGIVTSDASATAGTLVINSNTTLTEDHNGNVVIGTDNVTLDCAGHAIVGPGGVFGVLLNGRRNATVTNCDVSGFLHGVGLLDSVNNTITNTRTTKK